MRVTILSHLLMIIVLLCSCSDRDDTIILSAPAGDEYVSIDRAGKTVLPNGRIITPVGRTIQTAPHPYGLVLSNDGSIAVTANSGTSPLSISIIKNVLSDNPTVMQVPPGSSTDKGVLASVFMGLALSPDNKIVYVAGGQENKIYMFSIDTGEAIGEIDCSQSPEGVYYGDGYIGDMVMNRAGSRLYAVDQMHFRVVIIDVESKTVLNNVPVGRYPFGIALSPDESRLYVANVGMFVYQQAPRVKSDAMKETGLKFPPFGFNTKEMREGIKSDTLDVPGLGDPNVPESFSVWTIDLKKEPQVVARIKTGYLVGEPVEDIPAVGGSSPNSIVATDKYVFVSNGNNDNISVIDVEADTILTHIALKPHKLVSHFRGVIPFGLALSPDNKRLYVAESGINAVGVIRIKDLQLIGHIPTAWFPSKLQSSADGKKLVVANAKGFGSGPNGGVAFNAGPEGSYIGNLMKGVVSVFETPSDHQLKKLTSQVIDNNFKMTRADAAGLRKRRDNPVPLYAGEKESPIKHIVFIAKENRTFDEVFAQVKGVKGDTTLARYGRGVTFSNRDKSRTVDNATIMPNHLQLAKEFSIGDNFYVDSDVSADGHRWLVNTYPNEWVETTTPASYGGNRSFRHESRAPGRFAMNGAAGAIYPEDYNEAGSMWDHLERYGVDFFNFGFGIMFEPASYHESFKYTGIRHFVNYPVPSPMFDKTSKIYPTYNMAIPDQFRIDQFIKEFSEKWGDDGEEMPPMLTVIIPNDHGAGERPDAGYPFRESYMADNDLAVGRIVEFLSHTQYWKEMLIVITEDDAQNGVDHVDAHRSVLMVISPFAKRGYVGHGHYSFGSIFKTFWNILGLPYLNQYDAGASDMADMFTATPDFAPYRALAVDKRVFEPQAALDPLDEKFDWKAISDSPIIDNPVDMLRESKEQDSFRLEDRERKKEH